MTIYLNSHTVHLTPSQITIDQDLILSWDKPISVSTSSHKGVAETQDYIVSVQGMGKRQVEVYNDAGVRLVFVSHIVREGHEHKVDHLGFYVDQGEGLSLDVYGLIGKDVALSVTQ